jgi:hypothetical protein
MEMTVKMTKKEAETLLKDALKPKLGETEFRVKQVEWSAYDRNVSFELTTEPVKPDEEEA